MSDQHFTFSFQQYDDIAQLDPSDAELLQKAREVTKNAYAPYSNFHVGAIAMLENGEMVAGTNQENAAYPVGICAERVLLGNAATLFPNKAIQTLAVSYRSADGKDDQPVSPCGMCRQALLEYEQRTSAMRVIMSGQQGKVIILSSARNLLPFAFTGELL